MRPMGMKTRTRRRLRADMARLTKEMLLDGRQSQFWEKLIRDLKIAEARRAAAMRRLSAAERRYFAPPPERRGGPEPAWYRAARRAEAERAAIVERLSWRIARTRATTRNA